MKQKGPWTVISSNVEYENPWITVRQDEVIRPDGKKGIFGVVDMLDGITALPIDTDGFVYLTREYRFAYGDYSIEAVSGGLEKNEKPIHAARRELIEEIGISAQKLISLGKIYPFTSIIDSNSYLYIATDLSHTKKNPDKTEKITTLKMSYKEAIRLVHIGKIVHAATIVLLLKAEKYIKGGI